MAKSIRSKAKRSFRAKKREEGVYAATAAARLERLNSKLVATVNSEAPLHSDNEDEDSIPGWLMFGLVDAEDITVESMGHWTSTPLWEKAVRVGGRIDV